MPTPTPADDFAAQRAAIKDGVPHDTCPFFGVGTSLAMRQATRAEQIQSGGQSVVPDLAAVFIPCLQEKCSMWHQPVGAPGECAVKRGFLAMASRMAPLTVPSVPSPKLSVTPRE